MPRAVAGLHLEAFRSVWDQSQISDRKISDRIVIREPIVADLM